MSITTKSFRSLQLVVTQGLPIYKRFWNRLEIICDIYLETKLCKLAFDSFCSSFLFSIWFCVGKSIMEKAYFQLKAKQFCR